MKNTRQRQILSLIEEFTIETQEELMERLRHCGFQCTQATVSRDIKELRLMKVADERGGYKYAQPTGGDKKHIAKYSNIIVETVLKVNYAGTMVVINTFPGMANAACAAIDALKWDGMLGSIAGDDTIFIVMHSENLASAVTDRIRLMLRENG